MKTTIRLVLAIIMVVFFADFSQSEIISRKYDANSDRTLNEYRVVGGDSLWTIYENNYPGRATTEAVENEIAKPNGILDPLTIQIGTVIKFEIKGNVVKSVTKDTPSIGVAAPEIEHSAIAEIISSNSMLIERESHSSYDSMCVDNVKKYINTGKEEEEFGKASNAGEIQELRKQLKISLAKIEKLKSEIDAFKKLTKEKDEQNVFLEETGDYKLKTESGAETLKREEAQKARRLNEFVLKRTRDNRIKWASITGFCVLIIFSYIGHGFIKNRRQDYPKKKRKKFYF